MKIEEITILWGCSIDVIDMCNSLGTGMRAELQETLRDWVSVWGAHNETRWREDWAHFEALGSVSQNQIRTSTTVLARKSEEELRHGASTKVRKCQA